MALIDPITDAQQNYVESLAREIIPDYEGPDELDRKVRRVYGRPVAELNRGQAAMLIDELRYEAGLDDERPDQPSIFEGE